MEHTYYDDDDDENSCCGGGFCHAIMTCPNTMVNIVLSPFDSDDVDPALNSSRDPIATAVAGFTLPCRDSIPSPSNEPGQPPPQQKRFKLFHPPRKKIVAPYTPQTASSKLQELRNETDDDDDEASTKRQEPYQDNPMIVLDMGPPRDEDDNELRDISI